MPPTPSIDLKVLVLKREDFDAITTALADGASELDDLANEQPDNAPQWRAAAADMRDLRQRIVRSAQDVVVDVRDGFATDGDAVLRENRDALEEDDYRRRP